MGIFLKVFNFSYVSRVAIDVVSDSLFASIRQENRIFSPSVVTVAVLLVAHIDVIQRFSDVVTKVVSGRRLKCLVAFIITWKQMHLRICDLRSTGSLAGKHQQQQQQRW